MEGEKLLCATGEAFTPWSENENVCATCKGLKSKARTAGEVEKQMKGKGRAKADGKKEGKKEKKVQVPVIETQPEQGCRDFPPEEYRLRHWLFGKFRSVAASFGFEEYDCPVLEPEHLYAVKAGKGDASAGEEILEQMFNFTTKGGHKVALRPELTPSLARLVMKKGQSLLLPIKWFSIPQCWRYEAIVRGRKREHYQWNMDIWGVPNVAAESELLASVVAFFKSLGLTSKDVGIKINSRKLLQTVLKQAGVKDEQFAPVCIIIDKVDKLERAEIEKMLGEKGLSPEVIDVILNTLKIQSFDGLRQVVGAEAEVVNEMEQLFENLDAYGLSDWVQLDASVVRGLAYYTGVVFEGFDRAGHLRAICGGGRYDTLLDTFGHTKSIPAAGFGFGDCVIVELLKDKNLVPQLTAEIQDILIPFNESMRANAVSVMMKLRKLGRSVDIILEKKRSLKQAFSYADSRGAERVVLVAPGEWARGTVTVKNMRDAQDDRGTEVTIEDLIKMS